MEEKKTAGPAATGIGRWTTRELELVISGAVIVALLQLPGIMSDWTNNLSHQLSRDWFMVPYMFYYCGLLVVYPVILCFLLHFGMRGFWIGLLGLNAVFPDGIRWDKWTTHPLEKAYFRGTGHSVKSLAASVDKVCGLLFSLMFTTIIILFTMYSATALVTLILIGITYLFTPRFDPLWLMIAAYCLVFSISFGPRMLGTLLTLPLKNDPEWSERHPRRYGTAMALMHFSYYTSLGFLTMPILWTQSTNLSRTQMTFAHLGLVGTALICALTSVLAGSGILGLTSDIWFPAHGGATSANATHYENRAPSNHNNMEPFIQSDLIEDAYLRLTVPFDPNKDNRRIARFCPDLEPLRHEGIMLGRRRNEGDADYQAGLFACIDQLITVELNGQPVQTEFLFSRDPGSQLPSLVTYIPCDHLPKGRNLLTVTKVSLYEKESRRFRPPTRYIPFWKSAP